MMEQGENHTTGTTLAPRDLYTCPDTLNVIYYMCIRNPKLFFFFSMRSLCRALDYAARCLCGSLQRSLYEVHIPVFVQ